MGLSDRICSFFPYRRLAAIMLAASVRRCSQGTDHFVHGRSHFHRAGIRYAGDLRFWPYGSLFAITIGGCSGLITKGLAFMFWGEGPFRLPRSCCSYTGDQLKGFQGVRGQRQRTDHLLGSGHKLDPIILERANHQSGARKLRASVSYLVSGMRPPIFGAQKKFSIFGRVTERKTLRK